MDSQPGSQHTSLRGSLSSFSPLPWHSLCSIFPVARDPLGPKTHFYRRKEPWFPYLVEDWITQKAPTGDRGSMADHDVESGDFWDYWKRGGLDARGENRSHPSRARLLEDQVL